MKKFRHLITGFYSLIFILISSVVFGQTNSNPLNISNNDYYYEAKSTDNLSGDYLIVRKTNSTTARIVSNTDGVHDFYFNGGFIFGNYGEFGYLTTENGVINNPGGALSPYISTTLNRNAVKWNFLSNDDNTYLLYNVLNNNYLRNYTSSNYQYFDHSSNTNQSGMNWVVSGMNSIKNSSTNQYLNYKTITGRSWLGIFGGDKSKTEMFLDDNSSNINLYKRLRLDYENQTVPVNTQGLFSRRSETLGLVNYTIEEGADLVTTTIEGGNFVINYNQEGIVKVKAVVNTNGHIPSYTKTFNITILPSHVETECYKKTITNGITNSGFSLRSGVQFSNNTTGYIRLDPNSVLVSNPLSGISGRSVKVELIVASRINSNSPSRLFLSLENDNSTYNRGPVELRFNSFGTYTNLNNPSTSGITYRTVEYEFTRVGNNSRLVIETPPGVVMWFKEVKIKCAQSTETIWEGGQWSNGIPTTVDKAVLRENINTNVNAYSLRIEKNDIVVPSGISFNIINEINIVEGRNLKFEKGAYLFTGKDAQINRNIEFETSSKYYYWDTRMVSSPVLGQQFTNIFGPNRSNSNNKDYTIFDLVLSQSTEYNNETYIGKWIAYELASFEPAKAYSLQRYRKNNVMLPRYGVSTNPPVTFTESFIGIPNTSDYKVNVQRPGRANYNGSYAIGNPYSAPIDIKKFLNDNSHLEFVELYRNDNSYNFATGSYKDNSNFWNKCNRQAICDNGNYKVIDVGTGFMVTYLDGNIPNDKYEIKINHSSISTQIIDVFQNNNRSEDTEFSLIKLALKKDSHTIGSKIVLAHSDKSTNNYDYGFDIKMRNDSLGIKSISQNELYDFDFRDNNINNDNSFRLSLNIKEADIYKIELGELSGLYLEHEVYLKDNYTNEIIDLKNNPNYSFYSDAGFFKDRFEILFDNLLSINNLKKDEIILFNKDGKIVIRTNDIIESYKVYTIEGRLERSEKVATTKEIILNNLDSGVFIINIQLNNGKSYSKKFLK